MIPAHGIDRIEFRVKRLEETTIDLTTGTVSASEFTALQADVAIAEAAITTLQGQVTTLQNQIAALPIHTEAAAFPSGGKNGDTHFNTDTGMLWIRVNGAWQERP